MNQRMCIAAVLTLMLTWAALPAFPQSEVVLTQEPGNFAGYDTVESMADVRALLTDGVNLRIIVDAGPEEGGLWSDGYLSIPSNSDVTVEANVLLAPYEVGFDAGDVNTNVIEVATGATASIEGLALTGGRAGISAGGTASTVDVERCYIRDNADVGIQVADTSTAHIANCSIVDNGADGITVASSASLGAEILFCTILDNLGDGVDVLAGAKASMWNCILAGNGGWGANATADDIDPFDLCDFSNNTGGEHPGSLSPSTKKTFDPVWATAPVWKGQLDTGNTDNQTNLRNQGTLVPEDDVPVLDFEGEPRPMGGSCDIGADEFTEGGSPNDWFYCEIQPSPIGGDYLEAGLLRITLGINLSDLEFHAYDGSYGSGEDRVLLVPQHVREMIDEGEVDLYAADIGDYAIPINMTDGSGALWLGTNANRIETRNAYGTVNDGVAWIYIIENGTSSLAAQGQAVSGRKVIIDTVGPQIDFSETTPIQGYGADWFVTGSNDVTAATDYGVSGQHDFPELPSDYLPKTAAVPYGTDGRIKEGVVGEPGACAFFNVGSESNGYAATPLQSLQIRVRFYDAPPPSTEEEDTDDIVPSGFDSDFDGYDKSGDVETYVTGDGSIDLPATWIITEGADYIESTDDVSVTYELSDGDESLEANWTFTEFPAERAANNDFHIAVKFRARDAAGNITEKEELLDPLHLWWLISADTQLSPHWDSKVERPYFSWSLRRNDVPAGAGEDCQPRFTYRLWEGQADDKDGLYTPIDATGWSGWGTATTLSYTSLVNELESYGDFEDYTNKWLFIAVVGADEAGNVEPWPSSLNGSFTFSSYAAYLQNRRNWQRFYITSVSGLDTGISATFWHNNRPYDDDADDRGEASFGNASVLPYPADSNLQHLDGRIEIQPKISQDLLDQYGSDEITVYWQLYEGNVLDPRTPPANDQPLSLTSPTALTVFLRDLGDPDEPVSYVLSAWARLELGGGTYILDETPANLHFTVVPNSVSDYVEPKDATDDQPIKAVGLE